MNIRGITKFSMVDYPAKFSCVLFVGNCNFKCPYCHNPVLVVDPSSQPLITQKEIFSFLHQRKGKLDAVVISGGEPTLRSNLPNFIEDIKELGFLVKLDTNGSNPEVVKNLINSNLINLISIDYKAPTEKYPEISGSKDGKIAERVKTTVSHVIKNKIPYDIRTTVHKTLIDEEDLFQMRKELNELGVKDWIIQQFTPAEDLLYDELAEKETFTDKELLNISENLDNTKVRGIKGFFL